MSTGEMAYLAMVLAAFATFISVVGFISVWSREKKDTGVVALPPHRADKTADDGRAYLVHHAQPASNIGRVA